MTHVLAVTYSSIFNTQQVQVDGDGTLIYPDMVMDATRNPHNSVKSHHSTSTSPIHFAYFINPIATGFGCT